MKTLIPLPYFLVVAGILFAIGMLVLLTKRNAIAALMGIELMLNAANLNLVAFSQYDKDITGQMFSLFVIVIAAAETAVALAIIILVFRHYQTIHLHKTNKLKD
jgi:NAD(P)H-quinone oxidoreductase subunit 4L